MAGSLSLWKILKERAAHSLLSGTFVQALFSGARGHEIGSRVT
jgi:hypothetical protein